MKMKKELWNLGADAEIRRGEEARIKEDQKEGIAEQIEKVRQEIQSLESRMDKAIESGLDDELFEVYERRQAELEDLWQAYQEMAGIREGKRE